MNAHAHFDGEDVYRPVPQIEIGRARPKIKGAPGKPVDVPLEGLVIDGRYQRVFTPRNEDRVRGLVSTWNWALYTPIVIAEIESGYAVIDGQHRAAAALAIGIEDLPAWLVEADDVAQAEAFLAINAKGTRVDTFQLWHARHAAKEAEAVALFAVCARAGVEVSRYAVGALQRRPNVTLCPAVINTVRKVYGDKATVRMLKILVAVGVERGESLLTKRAIAAVTKLLTTAWDDIDDDMAVTGLAQINFGRVLARAHATAKETGRSSVDCAADAIMTALAKRLEREG